ncbi:MAG TPA: GNAT family N-acetyltransferase [Chitinophagaceae bacterium]
MVVESERLYARRYTLDDEAAFFRLNSDEVVMRYIRPPKSREDSHLFLLENLRFYEEHPGLGRWALVEKNTGAIVGSFSLLFLENTNDVHIGYALLQEHWGKGYAAEIVKAGLRYVFNELKLPTLVAVTYPDNIPSQKVLLKNNFKLAGTHLEDGLENPLYRLDRSDYEMS